MSLLDGRTTGVRDSLSRNLAGHYPPRHHGRSVFKPSQGIYDRERWRNVQAGRHGRMSSQGHKGHGIRLYSYFQKSAGRAGPGHRTRMMRPPDRRTRRGTTRTLGHEHVQDKGIDSRGQERFRSEMRPAPRSHHDPHVAGSEHGRTAHVDFQIAPPSDRIARTWHRTGVRPAA